jgi:hypothetical protein
MAIILKANKVNLFVSSVLFVFWYHSPKVLDTPRAAHNFINHRPHLACNSEGTNALPDDGTQVPKHVGAEK